MQKYILLVRIVSGLITFALCKWAEYWFNAPFWPMLAIFMIFYAKEVLRELIEADLKGK